MCGICGRLDFEPGRDSSRAVLAMKEDMAHRGPDGSGMHQSFDSGLSVCLGHRRLAIIDLTDAASQPMSNERGDVTVVFNGEIYNFLELRRELKGLGHTFRSRSDTEVIVHAYEQWGPDAVTRLRGMFAIGIWDAGKKRLVLARDRLGKKPLFYYPGEGFFSFSSSLGSLIRDPDVPKEMDHEALDLYLTYQYVPAPRTIFKRVKKLPPAHVMVVDKKGVSSKRYWRVDFSRKLPVTEEEAGELVREKLAEAVRLRLVSDVPLGAFLSGGMDSGIVVALMAREGGAVKTFSVGFEDEVFSELEDAKRVAEMYNTDHHEFTVRPNAARVLPMLARHFGEPFADSSAIPTYYVANMTRRYVTVALNGDGGDESFAGYERYLAQSLSSLLDVFPPAVKRAFTATGERLPEPATIRHPLRRLKRFLEAQGAGEKARYLGWVCHFHPREREGLFRPELLERLSGFDPRTYLYDVIDAASGPGTVDRLQETDIYTYLPEDLLVKVDVASMAVSLEARSPFLDHELVELAAMLPSSYKLKNLTTKSLLKKSFGGLLPQGHTKRPKRGFGVPISRWLREDLKDTARELIFSEGSLCRELFNPARVEAIFTEHQEGRRDHGYRLYSLMMLELWHREVFRGD